MKKAIAIPAHMSPGSFVHIAVPYGKLERIVICNALDRHLDTIELRMHGVQVLEFGPCGGWEGEPDMTGGEVARQVARMTDPVGADAGPLFVDVGLTVPQEMTPACVLKLKGKVPSHGQKPPYTRTVSVVFIFDQPA